MRLEHLLSGEDDYLGLITLLRYNVITPLVRKRFALKPSASLLLMFIDIEKDEAERKPTA